MYYVACIIQTYYVAPVPSHFIADKNYNTFCVQRRKKRDSVLHIDDREMVVCFYDRNTLDPVAKYSAFLLQVVILSLHRVCSVLHLVPLKRIY